MGEDRNFGDILTSLEGKPDQYNNLLKKMEGERCFGDTKFYCPVTFVEQNLLRKGSPQCAAKFRYRLYYCADEETLQKVSGGQSFKVISSKSLFFVQKFLDNPMNYLPEGGPHSPPPPRICITGSPGCGQEEVHLTKSVYLSICIIGLKLLCTGWPPTR